MQTHASLSQQKNGKTDKCLNNACVVKRPMTRKVTACACNERLLLRLYIYKLFVNRPHNYPLHRR